MSITNLLEDLGKTVSFTVYPTAVLGNNFKKVTLLGILDYESAGQYLDVAVTSIAVYPTLPAGTIKDYTKYRFLKVRMADGTSKCVALEWIDKSTYQVHTGLTLIAEFPNVTASDADRIRAILAGNGITDVNMHF